MTGCFLASTMGAPGFAMFPTYAVAAVSLFVMGGAMATLQVVINPLLRVAGGVEHFAFNSALAQLVFGAASFISPFVYSYLVPNLPDPACRSALVPLLRAVAPKGLAWVSMYRIFAACTAAMAAAIALVRLPAVKRNTDESAGTIGTYKGLLRRPMVWIYFSSVFAYVGPEQGTADWISKFLYQYHGYDPHTTGAAAVSWFWGMLTAGCFIGMFLLKLFDRRRALVAYSAGALASLTAALTGPREVAPIAFPAVGFFASIMWPTLVSLALNPVSESHGAFAGILCTGIMGGAGVPVIIGRIGDGLGLRMGLFFLYPTFGCVMSVGFWAKPLIQNATLGKKGSSPWILEEV